MSGVDRQGVEPTAELLMLENLARAIGNSVDVQLPEGVGFALLIFEYGQGGLLTWISSAQRQDMVNALRECSSRLEQKS